MVRSSSAKRYFLGLIAASALPSTWGCSSSDPQVSSSGSGGSAQGSGQAGADVTYDASVAGRTGSGGSPLLTAVQSSDDASAAPEAATPKRPQKCDDAGHCSCMNIASIGQFGAWGVGTADDTAAFRDWLNTKSSAAVDTLTTRVTLTSDLLSQYDVVILQSLGDGQKGAGPFWTFSADEQTALADWVQAGGGLITLQGYGTDAQEIDPVNELLQFSGISYDPDDILTTCPPAYNNLCQCWGNTTPISNWSSSDPISSAISAHVTEVGGNFGRPIEPGDATVCATDDASPPHAVAVAKEVGQGRVLAFADEWITYTSQWLGTGQAGVTTSPICRSDSGGMRTADQEFQVAQFWYNIISWVSAASSCPFVLDEPNVTPH